MKLAFVGDIHGRVLHTMAILCAWQMKHRVKLDGIVQVGDLGAYPEPSEEVRQEKYVRLDAAELDYSRMLRATGKLADAIRYVRDRHLKPIHFIRGNHEDFDWLTSLEQQSSQGVAGADPYDMYRYAADGTILRLGSVTIGFLGGIQTSSDSPQSIHPSAFERLLGQPPGSLDVLVTHDAPYGIATNYHGHLQGSTLITELIEAIQPRYLIAGHYHHMNGPRRYGDTTYLGLSVLVDLKEDALEKKVQPGSLAILDTDSNVLSYVTDDWLAEFGAGFDFESFVEQLRRSTPAL